VNGRYVIFDLDTYEVVDEFAFDDFDEALNELRLQLDLGREELDEVITEPDLVVFDLEYSDCAEIVEGRVVWNWLDAFSGVWRRRVGAG